MQKWIICQGPDKEQGLLKEEQLEEYLGEEEVATKRFVKRKKYSDNRRNRQRVRIKNRPKSRRNETQENGLIVRRSVYRKKDTEGAGVNELGTTNNIIDHNFLFDEPSHLADVENKIIGSNAAVYYVEPTFEYLSPEWERFCSGKSELDLPNLYLETDYTSENDKFKDLKVTKASSSALADRTSINEQSRLQCNMG